MINSFKRVEAVPVESTAPNDHRREVGLHGREDLRPVGHYPKRVGDVATLGKGLVAARRHFSGYFAAI
jgi:hypothetical protein